MNINCPWCGSRSEQEFTCGGESHIARPSSPGEVSDGEWAAYLYQRSNPKGLHYERWCHSYGCRQWFNVARDTISHDVLAVYKMNEPKPVGVAS